MKLEAGQKIRDYEIQHLIGEGGMGEVYQAQEVLLGRQVAIKRLNPHLTGDPGFAQRFINEARIQAQLTHPNIVGLHSFFEEQGVYYMILEFVPGITLRQLISQTGPIPEERAMRIFRQITAALAHAHAKGIVHRDVKPSNIIVNTQANDAVKVMDFGIARLLTSSHLTSTGTKLGTVHYMSPEQVLEAKDIDQRSDLYSAGIVFYEMLSGRLPFDDDTASDFRIQEQIIKNPVPDPRMIYAYISDKSVELLNQLTQKDREARPNGFHSLSHLLEANAKPIPAKVNPVVHVPKPNPVSLSSTPQAQHPNPKATEAAEEKPPQREEMATPSSKSSRKALWFILVIVIIAAVVVIITLPKAKEEGREMVMVAGGTFSMGSENGDKDEKPIHSVTVSTFYIAPREVTQQQWREVMGNNPSYHSGDNLPVENISWLDAVDFCNRLSEAEGLTPCYTNTGNGYSCNWSANGYRLPTESEWEYAARGGANSQGYKYSGSNNADEVAWTSANSQNSTRPVATLKANELGLYDMSGNVLEWCWDWHADSYPFSGNPIIDPRGASSGKHRVLRGGSWRHEAYFSRVTHRSTATLPEGRLPRVGFRLVRSML